MKKQVFLSALGIINSLGNSGREIFENLILGNTQNISQSADFIDGKTLKFGLVLDELPEIKTPFEAYNARCNQLLLAAYLQIENEVKEAIEKYGSKRIAIVISSSTSGVDNGYKIVEHCLNPDSKNFDYSFLEMGHPAKFLASYLGLNNIFYTISTACSSGAKAFLSAQNLLELGLCDAVLVGGSDILCKLAAGGFDAMEAVLHKTCNPFSRNRDGIMLGEGAALFLMTTEKSSIALLGVGESSDAHHITAPDPSGKGALMAMNKALKQANLKPQDVDYINLHGTGTKLNDLMESLAVNALFSNQTLCSSTKAITGHTLGAAGIIEAGLCWLLLSSLNKDYALPPHIWDGEIDPDLAPLNFVKTGYKSDAAKLSICLSNSFAFGGSNASVIIGKS